MVKIERQVAELQEQQAEKQREIQQATAFIKQLQTDNPEAYQHALNAAQEKSKENNSSVDEVLLEAAIIHIRNVKAESEKQQTSSSELDKQQLQQLRENAIRWKDHLEANEPEQFQALQTAAKEVAEQQEIEIAEAMILMLMKAIDEQKKG